MSEQEKAKSFMQELDLWTDANVVGPLETNDPKLREEWEAVVERVKKAIRTKVLESYRNGQAAHELCAAPAKQPLISNRRRKRLSQLCAAGLDSNCPAGRLQTNAGQHTSMKILGTLVSEDWDKVRDFADPFGITLGTMGAAASEQWFTVYFKSGRDNTVENQGAEVVLLETHISDVQHNLILDLTKPEAQQLRAKCDRINKLREQLDEEQSLADFADGEVADYIGKNA